MPNILLLFTFLALSLGYNVECVNKDKPSSPDELANRVVESLRTNDLKCFKKLIFTDEDCEIMANSADANEEQKLLVVKQMKGLSKRVMNSASENFAILLDSAKSRNIDWSRVEIIDIEAVVKIRQNIYSADIFVKCKSDDVEFRLFLDNCHKSDGWLMMDDPSILD